MSESAVRRELRRQKIIQNTERRLKKIENLNRNVQGKNDESNNSLPPVKLDTNWSQTDYMERRTESDVSPPVQNAFIETPRETATRKSNVPVHYIMVGCLAVMVHVAFTYLGWRNVVVPFFVFEATEYLLNKPEPIDVGLVGIMLVRLIPHALTETFLDCFKVFSRMYRDFMLYMFTFVLLNLLI